ncbi:hypothetical protein M8J76_008102 [Diaphorina citri]|nr:hypothetical protein M8J76_008102 [Diaphorina citri]
MFSSTSMDERISIRDSAKSLKKYGSTSNNGFRKPETFVKHMISSSDTLQGIALKYGVTTEQIRRTNRLWANDSLFLRESLLIPVPLDRDSLMTSPTDVSLFDISECSQFVNSTTDDFSAADGVTAGSSTNPSRSGSFRSDSGTSGISSTYNGDMKGGGGRSLSNGDIKSGAAGASSNGHYDPDAYTEFLVRFPYANSLYLLIPGISSTYNGDMKGGGRSLSNGDIKSGAAGASSNGHYDPDAYTEFLVRFPYANSLYLLIPGISSTYNGDMKGGGRSLSNGDIKSGAAGASSNGHYDPDAYTEFLVRFPYANSLYLLIPGISSTYNGDMKGGGRSLSNGDIKSGAAGASSISSTYNGDMKGGGRSLSNGDIKSGAAGASSISSTYNGDMKGGGRSLSNGDIKSGAAGASSNGHYDPDAYTEFLVRIDCDIASTRSQVIQAQGKSEFRPQDDDCIFLSKRKPQSRRKQAEAQATALTELPSVVTQGSRVRTSLQKMQEKHDELFEL